jgi:hypothetical protein
MLPSRDPTVIFQKLGDGAVLFLPRTEIYFGLNEVGARVWELLPPVSGRLEDIIRVLLAEYPDATEGVVRADVTDLLADLRRADLVLAPGSAAADDSAPS